MSIFAKVLVLLIGLEHLYILYMEMFLWTHPKTLKKFNMTPEFAQASKALAGNQGLYNGFLAAGLLWSLADPSGCGKLIAIFFAGCVLVAGIYGGFTAIKKIFYIQALPAAVTLAVLLFT
jgi:putative membrane protein